MSSPTYTLNKPGALFFIPQWNVAIAGGFHTRIPLYQNLSDVVVCFSEMVWLDLFDDGIYDGEYTEYTTKKWATKKTALLSMKYWL